MAKLMFFNQMDDGLKREDEMKPQYNAKELFLRGLMAFGRIFAGSGDVPNKSFRNPTLNPAGAKLVRRWYKAKTGVKADYATALDYYNERQQ